MEVIADKVEVAIRSVNMMISRGTKEKSYQTCMLVTVCVISRTLFVAARKAFTMEDMVVAYRTVSTCDTYQN